MDQDEKAIYWMVMALLALGALVFLLAFAKGQLGAERYYDCVYTVKSASVTPSDIRMICER